MKYLRAFLLSLFIPFWFASLPLMMVMATVEIIVVFITHGKLEMDCYAETFKHFNIFGKIKRILQE